MPESQSISTRTEFARLVRDALNRLYDSGYLENHPLSRLLLSAQSDKTLASQELRRILLTAIQSMHPDKTAPKESHDWRVYRILELRYITGLTASEVMQRLSLGRSLFFLEQARALNALVDRLWLQAQAASLEPEAKQKSPFTSPIQIAVQPQASLEVDRLLGASEQETLNLGELLENLQPVLQALVQSQGGELIYNLQQRKLVQHVNRVLLRQVIVSLISHGLEKVPAGQVRIWEHPGVEPGLVIRVIPAGEQKLHPVAELGRGMSLELCRQCLHAMRGKLRVENQTDGSWQAWMIWPASVLKRLLVIDDHADFIDLVRRFLAGQEWEVIGASDGESARQAIEAALPDIILLDVLLPKEDGWDLLLALQTDENTRAIPVIVCSALNEPGLVAALGGAAFLPKPLTRQALLATLAKVGQADSSPESENPGLPRAPE